MDSEPFKISLKKSKDFTLITPKGRIDTTSYKTFLDTCNPVAISSNIIFDFSNLNYISSVGIGAIIKLMKLAEAKKFQIILCQIPKFIFEIIKTTKLEKMFNIQENLQDAIQTMSSYNNGGI